MKKQVNIQERKMYEQTSHRLREVSLIQLSLLQLLRTVMDKQATNKEPPPLPSTLAQAVKNPPAMRETWVRSLGWEVSWEKGTATTPVFWPGESLGLWGLKELDMIERLSLLFTPHPNTDKYYQCYIILFNIKLKTLQEQIYE